MYSYKFPKADHTVDVVVLRKHAASVEVLLVQRKHEPFKGKWVFPGGFLDLEKDGCLEDAAYRETEEETGIRPDDMESPLRQFRTYSDSLRDPRGWVISTVFLAAVGERVEAVAGDDAKSLRWFDVRHLPPLAFDHEKIWGDISREVLGR